jgi:hypothetical protein
MKGDPDNIIISDDDAYDHEEFMNIHHPEPKAKAVPVKKTAVKRAESPRDRGSDSARRPAGAYAQARTRQAENDYRFSNGEGSEPETANASEFARHAKDKKPVEGKYKRTPEGPANGGKHGKSWDGKA